MSVPAPDTSSAFPPPPTDEPPRRRFNGVGLAALVVGAIALVLAFLPLASFAAFLPALAAIVLGVVGLVLQGRSRATAVAGLVLGGLALIIAIVLSVITAVGFVSRAAGRLDDLGRSAPTGLPSEVTATADPPVRQTPSPGLTLPAGEHEVVYTIEGAGTALVNHSTFAGGDSQSSAGKQRPLPFRKAVTVRTGNDDRFASFSVGATQPNPSEPVRCTITIDGQVVSTQESDRPTFAYVFCSVRSGY